MTKRLNRGTAPGRARHYEHMRPGSFKPGHRKLGGRKRGTPNALSADYKKAILEAAYRIGEDGNGKDGLVGYLQWIALYHTGVYLTVIFPSLLKPEADDEDTPDQPRLKKEDIDQWIQDYLGITGRGPTDTQNVEAGSDSSWAWTGQPSPVGPLMDVAVKNPEAFCKLIVAAFLSTRPKKNRDRPVNSGVRASMA
jgi:hypothetical protein